MKEKIRNIKISGAISLIVEANLVVKAKDDKELVEKIRKKQYVIDIKVKRAESV